MITTLKNFYIAAFDASDILEKTYNRNISLGDFDDFIMEIHKLTNVDIERCQSLYRESISWKDYFKDQKAVINFYLDKFVCVKDCYDYLSLSICNDKQVPIDALEKFKIEARSVPDIIVELTNKTKTVNSKIEKLKLFNSYLDSYISYLSDIQFRLASIVKGFGIRYWNSIDQEDL